MEIKYLKDGSREGRDKQFYYIVKKSKSGTGKRTKEEHVDCGQWRKSVNKTSLRLRFKTMKEYSL